MTVAEKLEKIQTLFREEQFVCDPARLRVLMLNSLGIEREISAAVYPTSRAQVQQLVLVANELGLPLSPCSRGRNIGYGERAPVQSGAVLVDLQRMTRIDSYDPRGGTVRIEPGVTQGALSEFLRLQGDVLRADMTGAGLDTSIVGNTLEGGFGHTVLGNRRMNMLDLEVVLGNGKLLETGAFPGLGPNLAPLFVQSNFGIVTAMRVPLFLRPRNFCMFSVMCREDKFLAEMVDTIAELRADGTLPTVVHVGNAVRTAITCLPFPEEWRNRRMRNQDAVDLLRKNRLPARGWTACGSLAGLPGEVRAKKNHLAKRCRRFASIRYFSESSIQRYDRILNSAPIRGIPAAQPFRRALDALSEMHNLLQGIPTDLALKNSLWREASLEEMGMIWFAPTFEARGTRVEEALRVIELQFERFELEMPLTISFVTPRDLVCVSGIHFNLRNMEQATRAHALYESLTECCAQIGVSVYRKSIASMHSIGIDNERKIVLEELKKTLDPAGIISPGRYGIGS